jgi:hypothetical protein
MFIDNKDLPTFKPTDKVKLYMKFLNRWVDYCPSDGLSIDDKNSICSFVTFTFKGFYYCIVKPNLRPEYQNNCSEGWKKDVNLFSVYKFKLSDLVDSSNSFNDSPYIFKVTKLEFNDESLFNVLPNDPIYKVRVDTEKEFKKHFKKVMKNLVV